MIKLLSVPLIATGFVSAFFFILYLFLSLKTKSMDKQHLSYLLFSIIALVNTIYTCSFAVLINSGENLNLLNIANRITIISSMFLIILTLHFFKYFLDLPGRRDLAVLYIINTVFSFLCLIDTPLFLAKKFFVTSRYYTGLEFGVLFQVWGAYVILMMLYAVIALLRGYLHFSQSNRQKSFQVLLLLLAWISWYALGVLDALTGIHVIDFPPATWIGSLMMLLVIVIMLVTTIENLHTRISTLYKQVIHDGTTQVFSKNYFEMELDRRLLDGTAEDAAQQYLVFVDIDDFKSINDIHGHVCGDEVLKRIAAIMKSNLRQQDLIARYGGDEFIMLMAHNGGIELTTAIIERIRRKVMTEPFRGPDSPFTVTCSFGIVAFGRTAPRLTTREELVAKADAALYKSKHEGKNRIYTLPMGG